MNMAPKKDADPSTQSSHLFMLRVWLEDLGGGVSDWRGRVQHVNSGEARYFRDWAALEAFVEELIPRNNPQGDLPDGIKGNDQGTR